MTPIPARARPRATEAALSASSGGPIRKEEFEPLLFGISGVLVPPIA
jgi:hypothetical protein